MDVYGFFYLFILHRHIAGGNQRALPIDCVYVFSTRFILLFSPYISTAMLRARGMGEAGGKSTPSLTPFRLTPVVE